MSSTQSNTAFLSPIGAGWRPSPLWLVLGLIWLTFFRLAGDFGLYEDDLHFFAIAINYDGFSDLLNWWKYSWSHWPQGRPMGYSVMYGLGFLGDRLGGIAGMHLIGFLIHSINAALIYRVVKEYICPRAALPATLFFALASIDVVAPAFTFTFYYDVAVMFFLIAANLYAQPRTRYWSYLFLAAAMLTQEPIAIAFFFFPWLVLPWNRKGLSQWMVHGTVWFGVIGSILVLRARIGDPWGGERVAAIAGSPLVTASRAADSLVGGFTTHLRLIFQRPTEAFADFGLTSALVIVCGVTAAALALNWERRSLAHNDAQERGDGSATTMWSRFTRYAEVRLLVVGLLCMSAPYAAYFRDYWYPCTAEVGFFSAVHVMATFGSALVIGGFCAISLRFKYTRTIGIASFAAYIGCLVLFGNRLQMDYAQNATQQRFFWKSVYQLCPDLEDGVDILVLNKDLPKSKFMNQFTWADELSPARIFRFPTDWKRPPRVYLVNSDVAGHHIRFSDGKYTWIFHPSILNHQKASQEVIVPGSLIVLRYTTSGYERVFTDLPVKDGKIELKSLGEPILPKLGHRRFGELFQLPFPQSAH